MSNGWMIFLLIVLGYIAVGVTLMRYLYTEHVDHSSRDEEEQILWSTLTSVFWPPAVIGLLLWAFVAKPVGRWVKKPYRHLPKTLRVKRGD